MNHAPEPQGISFSSLMNDIERGLIKIAQFQRDFVWDKEKSAKLLDSIIKGYPVGTFILWKTKDTLRTVRNLGGAPFLTLHLEISFCRQPALTSPRDWSKIAGVQ